MSIEKMNFKRWVHKVLPAVYDESLSYYELLCKVIAKLNEVIEQGNSTSEGLQELKDYVDHYFDNLDVQEEINNKLDEMAEQGQLTDIIAQYLQLAGVLAYDTKTAMKTATNLVDGSITKTLGNTTYQDGQGAFFKVRQVQNTDVIDDNNIIALNDPDLVAQKILYSSGYDNVTTLRNEITEAINDSIETKVKYLVTIGDSYNQETTQVPKKWGGYLKDYFNLNNSHYYNNSYSGTGFAYTVDDKNFYTLTTDFETLLSESERAKVTHVVYGGGYNDQYSNESDIVTAIHNTTNKAHQLFPNAKIYVAFIGKSAESSKYAGIRKAYRSYLDGSRTSEYGIFINDADSILTCYDLSNDMTHPTTDGYIKLAKNLKNGILTGACKPYNNSTYLKTTSNVTIGVQQQIGNFVTLNLYYNQFSLGQDYSGDGSTAITLGTLDGNSYINGEGNFSIFVPCMIRKSGSYTMGSGEILIQDKVVKIKVAATSNDHSGYFTFDTIRVYPNSINIPMYFC